MSHPDECRVALQGEAVAADLLAVHPFPLRPHLPLADARDAALDAALHGLDPADGPVLVLDHAAVAAAVRRFDTAFDGRVGVRYAVKCNPDPRLLRTVADAGGGFEIASHGELGLALTAGAGAPDVLFSNPVKAPGHVTAAARQGVRRFALDSPEELAKLADAAPGAGVYVRVRVDDTGSRWPLSSKFGTTPAEAVALLRGAADLGLVPEGVTFHVGSQCTDPGAWARGVQSVAPVLEALAADGTPLPLLDVGGGFPAQYDEGPVPTLEEVAERVLEALDALVVPPLEVVCEPGRALVAEAGTLVATVIGTAQRGSRRWVYSDAGAYGALMEAAQTAGALPFPVRTSRDGEGGPQVPSTLTGPTCDSSDALRAEVDLPAGLVTGDRVVVGCAGAYSTAYASCFNGFPLPRVVHVGAVPAAR